MKQEVEFFTELGRQEQWLAVTLADVARLKGVGALSLTGVSTV